MTINSLVEEGVKIGVRIFAKMEDVNDAILAVSGTLQQSTGSAFRVFQSAMKKHRLVKSTFFDKLEDLDQPEKSSGLNQNVNLVLASRLYGICGARNQTSSSDSVV